MFVRAIPNISGYLAVIKKFLKKQVGGCVSRLLVINYVFKAFIIIENFPIFTDSHYHGVP